jgi:hypothetical protein
LLAKERDFAEGSPMPPAEFADEGVYCTGDDCHRIAPKWERDKAEVMPPKSSIVPVWTVEGFGQGQGSSGKNAPIHFGDTSPASPQLGENEAKLAPSKPSKTVTEKVDGSKANGKAANGKSKAVAPGNKNGARNASQRPPAKNSAVPQGKRR